MRSMYYIGLDVHKKTISYCEHPSRCNTYFAWRSLHAKYVLHRLGCSQENDQLLCEGWQRADSRVRRDSRHTIGLGPLDENSPATVGGGDGSDHLHGLDLRSSASARSRIEGGTSADAACYCRGQEEE